MAENEGMEGKNLALNEFKQAILEGKEELENSKDGKNTGISKGIQIGGQILQIDLKKDEKESAYKINILGVHVLTLEDNELSFTDGWEEELREKAKGSEVSIDIDDLVDKLKEMEMELQKEKEENQEEQGIDEPEKDEEDLSKDKEEKEEDSPQEEKTDDEQKEEIAKKYNTNTKNVVNLNKDRAIAGKETLREKVPETRDDKSVFMVRDDKDTYRSHMVGTDPNGKQEEIDLDHSKGKNPDITVKLIEEDKITKTKPVEYYAINNREGLARIIRDGRDTWLYVRQEEGRGMQFQGVEMPRKDTRGVIQNPKDVRDAMDSRYNSGRDLAKRADTMEKQEEYEKLRWKINGRRRSSITRSNCR